VHQYPWIRYEWTMRLHVADMAAPLAQWMRRRAAALPWGHLHTSSDEAALDKSFKTHRTARN
jgi:hypothetical protein